MVYTPIRTVTISQGKLIESTDLSKSVGSFARTNSYLVLAKDDAKVVIDINKISLFETSVDKTLNVGSAFTSLLNDSFVARYQVDGIPLLNKHKTYDKRLRVFNPISFKDYKVQFTSMDTPQIVDDVSKKGFLDDLVITGHHDLSSMLVSVNGVFHKTSLFNDKLYVHDGFRTIRISGRKDVCLVDTRELGGHHILPLTTNNVTLDRYNGVAKITSPTSLRGKSVFIVIDGYFYHRDINVLYSIDDTHLGLKVNKLSLIDQFRHNPKTMYHRDLYSTDAPQTSRKYTDTYEQVFLDKRQVASSVFNNRDFQYSRITAYHSFLVIVDNPNLFTLSSDVLPTGNLKFYTDPINRILSGMLSYGAGLCPSYLILKDPYHRSSIFIEDQDYAVDYHELTLNPPFIPAINSEPEKARNVNARFVDYVST